MKKILITGVSGFIGSALCNRLQSEHRVAGLYNRGKAGCPDLQQRFAADLADHGLISEICMNVKPDVVIHCAGIAHQKAGSINRNTYFQINSSATENLARASGKANPRVQFIFLSSVSVYGEESLNLPVSETHPCHPTSDYGSSKLDAEKRLMSLNEKGRLKKTIILRLAPVYDREWSLNFDRRVMAPFRMAYLKIGSGNQEMSALARPNLIDFIQFLIDHEFPVDDRVVILNSCDMKPYTFHEVLDTFRRSERYPSRPVFRVPLPLILLATTLAGYGYPSRKEWMHACYKKLASSLIFDNKRMLETGFTPIFSLEDIYLRGRGV
ncbi:MAG: NAD-dependent epimerase/dehydratase family protein [Desulfobacterales bacterium]